MKKLQIEEPIQVDDDTIAELSMRIAAKYAKNFGLPERGMISHIGDEFYHELVENRGDTLVIKSADKEYEGVFVTREVSADGWFDVQICLFAVAVAARRRDLNSRKN